MNDTIQPNLNSISCPKGWGIFPRSVMTILEIISQPHKLSRKFDDDKHINLKVISTTLTACVIEIYFGQVKDMLNAKAVIPVISTTNADFDFTQATQLRIENIDDLQKLIDVVFTERQSRSTLMNDASSRSHCIATLFLTKIMEDEISKKKFVCKTQLQFVDLSGSERTSKTGIAGKEQIHSSMQVS